MGVEGVTFRLDGSTRYLLTVYGKSSAWIALEEPTLVSE